MTIRKKIFLLAGILLALFGAVVGTLAIIKKLNSNQLSHIVAYELPLSKLVSEFDVDTDRYELSILRVLRLESPSPEAIAAAMSATRPLADELRATVTGAIALLDRATQDSRYQIEDRLALARIEGSFKYLSRDLDDFLAGGTRRCVLAGRSAGSRWPMRLAATASGWRAGSLLAG